MARTFSTCGEHQACQVEYRENQVIHHSGDLQLRSPNSPEGKAHYEPIPVSPAYHETFKRWVARKKRAWKRRRNGRRS